MVSLLASFNSQPCTAGANWPEDRRLFPHSLAAWLDLESRESLTGIYPTTCFYFLSLPFRVASVLLTKDFDDTKPDDQHRHLSLRDFVSLCRAKKKCVERKTISYFVVRCLNPSGWNRMKKGNSFSFITYSCRGISKRQWLNQNNVEMTSSIWRPDSELPFFRERMKMFDDDWICQSSRCRRCYKSTWISFGKFIGSTSRSSIVLNII